MSSRGRPPVPIEDRFWDKVLVCPYGGCWEWLGARTGGYGVIKARMPRRMVKAHRVSYEIHNGPIPEGEMIRHSCDNPGCVNPSHLLSGTSRDNAQDREKRGRSSDRRGERAGGVKLNEEKIRIIRDDTRTYREIGMHFGVSVSAIYKIKNRKTWKDVV